MTTGVGWSLLVMIVLWFSTATMRGLKSLCKLLIEIYTKPFSLVRDAPIKFHERATGYK
jgi:hypothetical protein